MSLPKKDSHVHIEHDWYEVISCLADSDGLAVNAWIEQAAIEKADREARKASLITARLDQSGAVRALRERRGS